MFEINIRRDRETVTGLSCFPLAPFNKGGWDADSRLRGNDKVGQILRPCAPQNDRRVRLNVKAFFENLVQGVQEDIAIGDVVVEVQ